MSPQQIVERERRLALPSAITTMAGIGLFLVGLILMAGALAETESRAGDLRVRLDNLEPLLAAGILQGVGIASFAATLLFVYRAALARSERMSRTLIGLTVAGPAFLGLHFGLAPIALDAAASQFVEEHGYLGTNQQARDAFAEQGLGAAVGALQFAGFLATGAGLLYTCLHAMRTGLLTRFMGTLGMALGVVLLLGALPFVALYMLALSVLVLGRWPGGRPPAWEAGTAIPWPRPGERPGEPEAEPAEGGGEPARGDERAGEGEGEPAGEPRAAPEPREAPPPAEPGDPSPEDHLPRSRRGAGRG